MLGLPGLSKQAASELSLEAVMQVIMARHDIIKPEAISVLNGVKSYKSEAIFASG